MLGRNNNIPRTKGIQLLVIPCTIPLISWKLTDEWEVYGRCRDRRWPSISMPSPIQPKVFPRTTATTPLKYIVPLAGHSCVSCLAFSRYSWKDRASEQIGAGCMCLQSGKHSYRHRLAHADTYRHTLNLDGSIEIPDLLRARGFLAAHPAWACLSLQKNQRTALGWGILAQFQACEEKKLV